MLELENLNKLPGEGRAADSEKGLRVPPPCVLTIAGSDSGGGAGIQADLKTFMALKTYGSSVITALTAQNGLGVAGIHAPEGAFVALQLETVLKGFPVAAAKTGMLFSADIIKSVAGALRGHFASGAAVFPLVVDPVSVSQSGHRLLAEDAVDALVEYIVPLADLLTPNRPEAEMLAGMSINTPEDLREAIARILDLGPKAVLLKGGHFDSDIEVVDWLALPGEEPQRLPQPKVNTANNHGTGCTLGAAITAYLARGLALREAVPAAQRYLNLCLRESYNPGLGCGPVNHAANQETLPEVALGIPIDHFFGP